jgi:hypothetical protein
LYIVNLHASTCPQRFVGGVNRQAFMPVGYLAAVRGETHELRRHLARFRGLL